LWEAAYGAKYYVCWWTSGSVVDGCVERTRTSPGWEVVNLGNKTSRYVGILMVNRAPGMSNYSLHEVQVTKQ
jgi:hypothetical protein